MTTAQHAVLAALASVDDLYGPNTVPPQPTYPYGVVSTLLGRGDSHGLDRSEGVRHGRVVVEIFARELDGANDITETVRGLLIGESLTFDGHTTTTPLESELDPALNRDPDDDGVVGVVTTYTFTTSEES